MLGELSHGALAMLAREYLLCGHLIDRAGMPYVVAAFDRAEMGSIAIEEWMGASPVYTARMQKLLGFEGDDVATIFKGMQFDIGAPHGFMDFRYTVHDEHHGGFQLDHCGALMDVEPMGEEFVMTMCHDIEDPTFDATAAATNPRARMTPLHRPPREPADRVPHCSWTVEIDPEADPVPEAEITVLVAVIEELCLQQHLLAHAFMLAVARRHDEAMALQLGEHQFVGSAGMSAHRLARVLRELGPDAATFGGSDPDSPTGRLALLAAVLELHPALRPAGYVDVSVSCDGDAVGVALLECPGTSDGSPLSWPALLRDGCDRVMQAIVTAVDPNSRCEVTAGAEGTLRTWRVVLSNEPAQEQPEVALARFSTGTDFVLERAVGTEVSVTPAFRRD